MCLTKGFLSQVLRHYSLGNRRLYIRRDDKVSWFYRINAKQYWIIELSSSVSVDLKENVNVFVRELYSKTHTVTYSLKYIYSFFYNTVMSSLVYRCPEMQYIYFRHKSDIHLWNGLFFCFYAKLKTNLGLFFIFDMTLLMIFISNYK